jgi:hypothetical protein
MSSPLAIRKSATRTTDAKQAAQELYRELNQPGIKFAVFYCSPNYDLPVLAGELHALFGDINLIGCTTAGEITPQGYLAGSLTGVSLAGELDAAVTSIALNPFNSNATSKQVDALINNLGQRDGLPPSSTDTFAFMLIDGLAMQEELVVSCVYQQLQGIELIGGSAADDVRFGATQLYFRGQFHQHIALLTLVRTSQPFMAFRTQHFVQSSKRMVVTKSDPNKRVVYEINGRPAAREFAKLVNLQITELTPQIFATHPVVVRVGGQYYVRSIAKVNDDESLTFFCAIDEGIVLTIAHGNDMVDNLREAFEMVRQQVGQPQLVLGCDCILRRLEIERDGIKEQIGHIMAENNVIGFATYGEQFNAMHVNQTFTGIAIGSQS